MFVYRRHPSEVRIGAIRADRPFRVRVHVTRNQARNATRKATCIATRFATFPQFSTMFVRASFACRKLIHRKEIRIERQAPARAECGKMWKSGGDRAGFHNGRATMHRRASRGKTMKEPTNGATLEPNVQYEQIDGVFCCFPYPNERQYLHCLKSCLGRLSTQTWKGYTP